MAVKRGIRNSVILLTLSYASETWTWKAAQKSQIRAVEMSYMRGACGVSRWDRESNVFAKVNIVIAGWKAT